MRPRNIQTKILALAMALMVLSVANANEPSEKASTAQTQQSYPFDTSRLKDFNQTVRYFRKATVGSGKAYIVFVSDPLCSANEISDIYVINEGESYPYHTGSYEQYPVVTELIYHDLGKDKEFLGVVIFKPVFNKNTHLLAGGITYECRIDDEAGQLLLDYQAGATKWKPGPGGFATLKFSETKSSNLQPVRSFK